jgi:hypothetical protein
LVKTDISPEDFFRAWSQKKREALIELLIEMSDVEACDADLEPILASVEATNQTKWASGNQDDREGDPGCDDREDVCEDEGAEHDGREPDNDDGGEAEKEDNEPSLGWTCAASEGNGAWGSDNDREADGSHLTEAARQRYKPFDRYGHSNPDGMHVDVERGFGRGSRRLINLSDQQREALAPRITWGEVRI